MIPIVMFDILQDIEYFDKFFTQNEVPEVLLNIPGQWMDIDYDTHNPILILRTLFVIQILYFVRMAVLFAILYPLKKKFKLVKKYYKSLRNQLFFTEILVIYLESVIELLIAGGLYIKSPENNPSRITLLAILAYYFMFVPVILFPFLFIWLFTKSKNQINGFICKVFSI